jgi:hypothetical protein
MKQILEENGIIGKTIKATSYGDNEFCITFTDETFCIVKGTGYEDNDVEFSNEKINLEPNLYNARDLFKMGFISEDEAEKAESEGRIKEDFEIK